MSRDNSPYYADGVLDGLADADEIKQGREPIGMDGSKDWSGMYRDGYRDGLGDAAESASSTEPVDVDMSPIYS